MGNALTPKILITLGFLFAYRVLAYIPVPGVDLDVIKSFFDQNSNNALRDWQICLVGTPQ